MTDANTGDGINNATVTSTDHSADNAKSMATPDDPNLPDGYYWIFSTLTGSHPFSAAKAPYQADSKTVNVAANGATLANFSLKAGRLTINPSSVSSTQVLGTTTNSAVNISNTGTAPADVTLSERSGAFQILTMKGAPLRLIHGEEGADFSPGWLAGQHDDIPGVNAGAPRDPTWSTIAAYPTGIMDNSADIIDGKVYSVGGVDASFATTAKGYVYDPSTNAWTAIADMPVAREKPNVAAVNGKLFVTGGWDTSGNPIARTDVYDLASNSWSQVASSPHPSVAAGVAVVNGKIYYVGGCADSSCTPTTTVVSYDPGSDSWATLAAYSHVDAWASCGGISGKAYCSGGTDGVGAFKNGFAYDPGSDSWSAIADMPIDLWASAYGAANGLFLVSGGVTNGFSPTPDSELLSGLDQCGVTDVPWLTASPMTATLQPGQSVNVSVTLAATTEAKVTQPGAYTAQLGVSSNTPYTVNPINITMNVTPPRGWGKISGTVTGTLCNGTSGPLGGVQVQANGRGYTFTLKTGPNGTYAFWAPSASNSYTLIASKDGWIAQTVKTNIKAGKTVTVNFTLMKAGC